MTKVNELPKIAKDWLDGASTDAGNTDIASAPIQMASVLDYDGTTHQLMLTRADGTVQQFPANNNAQRNSRGKWRMGHSSMDAIKAIHMIHRTALTGPTAFMSLRFRELRA